MNARVFAFDPAALGSAQGSADMVRHIIDDTPVDVLERASEFSQGVDPSFTRLRKASVIVQVEDYVATVLEAIHALSNTTMDAECSSDPMAILGFGHVRLALLRGDNPVRTKAILGADQCDFFSWVGIDLKPAFSSLGIRALPLRLAASNAIAKGESTLAIADSVLAVIPRDLIERAVHRQGALTHEIRLLGRQLYQCIFPGRHISIGEDLLWRDAVVLASRAVMDFDEWRMSLASYHSAVGYSDLMRSLFEHSAKSGALIPYSPAS